LEYVARVDGLLQAGLSREALAEDDKQCHHCGEGVLAVWRCRDCSMGLPTCRGCMRRTHKADPFHRIERWNGQFFRPADLWEVGTYLLVRHHKRLVNCDIVNMQDNFLETLECRKDMAEQNTLHNPPASWYASANNRPATEPPANSACFIDDNEMSNIQSQSESDRYIRFMKELQDGDELEGNDGNEAEIDEDVEDDRADEEQDVPVASHYLPDDIDAEYQMREGLGSAQRIMGTYVRVVHTNGIHTIAMVNCSCQGNEHLAKDLLAARLLPASFERIRTIFTAQLLDYFRLSNLEVKASAFQFYHLLQRLTNPMEPSTVVNLYREFRRMSRIWRWMKRLKWAGFSNNDTLASQVEPGQLTIFCPACPQPGVNLPDNWKDDAARYATINLSLSRFSIFVCRWVYKRLFVADGNFKADHVRQKSSDGNVWLSEGGGMVPKRETYHTFLETAHERLTVCACLPARNRNVDVAGGRILN
jgi:KDZ transposase family protein